MNNGVVDIDTREVDELLNKLDDADYRRNLIYNAVKEGAKALQQNAQKLFRQRMGESAGHTSKYIRKPFYEGVSMKGDKAYITASVSILNDFRMKFFESGTAQRYTKGRKIVGYIKTNRLKREGKGHYTGSIKPLYFFRDAQNDLNAINEAMEKSINNALKTLQK